VTATIRPDPKPRSRDVTDGFPLEAHAVFRAPSRSGANTVCTVTSEKPAVVSVCSSTPAAPRLNGPG
jgi:hypothetical protein